MDLSNLSPQDQQTFLSLLGQQNQQSMDPSAMGIQPQAGTQRPPQPPSIQQQDGDKMHPMDAIKQITQGFSQPQQSPDQSQPAPAQQTTPQSSIQIIDKNGMKYLQQPNMAPLGRFFGKKTVTQPLHDQTNYYKTLVGLLGQDKVDSILPENTLTQSDGKPWVTGSQFKELVSARSLLPSSNNPPISLNDALIGGAINKQQYNQWIQQGLKPTDTKPATEWRIFGVGRIAGVKEGQLGVARNTLEAKLNDQFVKAISDSEQAPGSQMGMMGNILGQAVALRQGIATRYDPNTDQYDLNKAEVGDMMLGTARMLVRRGQLTNEQLDLIQQKTAAGDLNGAAQYVLGTNFRGNTQDIIRRTLQLADKEGLAAEQQRNMYASQNMAIGATLQRINPDLYTKSLNKAYGGVNYSQLLADSPDTKSPNYLAPNIVPITQTAAPGQPARQPVPQPPLRPTAQPTGQPQAPGLGVPHPRIRIKSVREVNR